MLQMESPIVIVRLSQGGGLFKTRPSREEAYSRGGLTREGDLFKTQIMFKKEAEFSPKKIVRKNTLQKDQGNASKCQK